ncbi:hypothetical protein Tco_0469233 [Tanacetum coccineum]
MVRDDKGKGKTIIKDKKQKLTGIKEVDDLEQRIKNTQEEDPKLVPIQTKEEDSLPIDVPRQTEEEDPLPLDIVYPLPEIVQVLREEVVAVKKPYNLVKVSNVILGLRTPKAKVGCSGSGRKRNS